VEASAIHARAGLRGSRVRLATPLLKLRSDQQLIGLFRAGNEDAFRVIHDRYRARLLAYIRQMLAGGPHPEAEDVLQDVFVRAYAGLRANGRELSLRPWLYRIAHNRCVDELRRPIPAAPEPLEVAPSLASDPVLASEQRESLRRLIIDIRRLPDQQRSALLMRELSGMAYGEIGGILGLSVPAVKSLLVRARMGLAAAHEARDTACHEIRSELAAAHDRGVRPSGLARRHLHDCSGCREYRSEVRRVSRQLAALTPVIGPLAALTRTLGVGSGGAAAGGTGSGVVALGGAASAGGTFIGVATSHVAAVVAAAVVTAGGAVEIQRTVAAQLSPPVVHHVRPATSVGVGTSSEGTVAASVVAPLSSAAATPVSPASAPAVRARRSRAANKAGYRQSPSAAGNSASTSAQGSTSAQPSTGPAGGTGTQNAEASGTSGSTAGACVGTTPSSVTPPQPCPPNATATTGATTSPTTTGASTGSDPTANKGVTKLTNGSSTPVSGLPSGPGTATPPTQKY
jgi:RNA polymerase sigma factor (sigma-70 family)